MTIRVLALAENARDLVGFIPTFLHEGDPRPAAEQFDVHYQHGGGWNPFPGFTLTDKGSLTYPGDPELKPVAAIRFRKELILIYHYGWVCVRQDDGSYEVSRMD